MRPILVEEFFETMDHPTRTVILHPAKGKPLKMVTSAVAGMSGLMTASIVYVMVHSPHLSIPLAVASVLCLIGFVGAGSTALLLPIEVVGEGEYIIVRFLFRTRAIHCTNIREMHRYFFTSILRPHDEAEVLVVVRSSRLGTLRGFLFLQDGILKTNDPLRAIVATDYRTAFDKFLDRARNMPAVAGGCGHARPD